MFRTRSTYRKGAMNSLRRATITVAVFVFVSALTCPVAVGASENIETQGCEWGENGFTTCDCSAYVDPIYMEGVWGPNGFLIDWPSARIEISDVKRNDKRRVRWGAQNYTATVKHRLRGKEQVTVLNVKVSKCYPNTFVLKTPMVPETLVDDLENTFDASKDLSSSAYTSPIRYGFTFNCAYIRKTAINSLSPADILLHRVQSVAGEPIGACPDGYMNRYQERSP
jgi:hypothetical protein